MDSPLVSTQRFAQDMLVRSTARTAPRELSVYDDGRQTSDAEPLGVSGRLVVLHIANVDFVLSARELLHHVDSDINTNVTGSKYAVEMAAGSTH